MDNFKIYEAETVAKEQDKKPEDPKATATPAPTTPPAKPADPKKKELDKTMPTRDMADVYKQIEPFIKRYAFNSFRNVQRINAGIMLLTFGGSFAKMETAVLFDLLDSKFNDIFTVIKNRFDGDSSTVTMTIF